MFIKVKTKIIQQFRLLHTFILFGDEGGIHVRGLESINPEFCNLLVDTVFKKQTL